MSIIETNADPAGSRSSSPIDANDFADLMQSFNDVTSRLEATHASLLKGMLSAFDVEVEVAKNDLDEFLADLVTAGLLVA